MEFQSKNMKEGAYSKDTVVNGTIISEITFRKLDMLMWTWFDWNSGMFVQNMLMNPQVF
jgi:hypothetical protein